MKLGSRTINARAFLQSLTLVGGLSGCSPGVKQYRLTSSVLALRAGSEGWAPMAAGDACVMWT